MRNVLITGTSSGFGFAATLELARRGWRVAATMRNLSKADALRQALASEGLTDRVVMERLDVAETGTIRERVEAVMARLDGRVDAVVHNAGVAVESAFEDLSEADARRIMETNFFGVLEVTRVVLPVMRTQRQGRILVVSSDSAFAGEPANSVYCASKWAIEGWSESLAYEITPFGLDIVLVEPGPYRTQIWDSAARTVPEGSAYAPFMAQLHTALTAHLAKTAGDPKDVGRAIADVLERRRPRFRNPIGGVARASHFARGKIASSVLRTYVTRYLGLDRIEK